MPTNTYICPKCGKEEQITSSFKDPIPHFPCSSCGTVLQWKPSQMTFVLKGGGWPGKEK